jgi:hypothetical protein
MTEEKKNEILKAHVFGYSIRAIAENEEVSEEDVQGLIDSSSDRIKELREWYGYED